MREELVSALSNGLPTNLAEELVSDFLTIRQDVASFTLGRSAPGKFVETVVQALQYLRSGTYETKPNVDQFLRSIESTPSSLDDGLRICAARIARSMYALRNKRNIAHKGDVDPNEYDLHYLHHAAQWILAEFVRSVSGVTMDEAGKLVRQIQRPIDTLVEDFGDRKIVLANLSAPKEVLVLLHSHYPEPLSCEQIVASVDRKAPGTVRNAIRSLWRGKLIQGNARSGYRPTQLGLQETVKLLTQLLSR